ncbi:MULTISPECIES: hypothetical protein [Brachybacterium]|uniref:EVE domain-containing protein n=2 Tax=Brachybacterium TaxID=43668 RepID=A0A3R8QPK0_9MICO|nr:MULTISPECIES: hypothetical protein [Brachybacterium]RRR19149.1 hypothetical protein DS079_07355 [Brachybacterium paraconglomeratum]GLI29536.1 hypothetical protein BCONGLO52_03770 [Brachybacterium conglomeratum]GLK06228.1 hypothetical protein GCM10017597_30280 [Brachybacterium conglomeratum]
MTPRPARQHEFWWSGDRSERFWIEQLKTDSYGDKLIAPDNSTYATMHGVEVGDVVFRWYSERHPEAGPKRGGIYAVSRVIGGARRSDQLWDGKLCVEIPVTPRNFLRRPILLRDLKELEGEFRTHQQELETDVLPSPLYSPWQFPKTGLKPMTRYLTKLTVRDVELIGQHHPQLAPALAAS